MFRKSTISPPFMILFNMALSAMIFNVRKANILMLLFFALISGCTKEIISDNNIQGLNNILSTSLSANDIKA